MVEGLGQSDGGSTYTSEVGVLYESLPLTPIVDTQGTIEISWYVQPPPLRTPNNHLTRMPVPTKPG